MKHPWIDHYCPHSDEIGSFEVSPGGEIGESFEFVFKGLVGMTDIVSSCYPSLSVTFDSDLTVYGDTS